MFRFNLLFATYRRVYFSVWCSLVKCGLIKFSINLITFNASTVPFFRYYLEDLFEMSGLENVVVKVIKRGRPRKVVKEEMMDMRAEVLEVKEEVIEVKEERNDIKPLIDDLSDNKLNIRLEKPKVTLRYDCTPVPCGLKLRLRKVKNWTPITRLGRKVKSGKYKSIKEIRRDNLLIQEVGIVEFLLGSSLTHDILSAKPIYDGFGVSRGYMSFVSVGDRNGHFGYSVKYLESHDDSIKGALERARLNISAVNRFSYRFGYMNYYTVAYKVSATIPVLYGDLTIRLIPSFGNAGIICNNEYIIRMLALAGIDNCVVEVEGNDQYIGNVALATYEALQKLEDEG